MANHNVAAAQAELINSGFRPARHQRLVRLIRRVLWPFIRPFHFHQLEMILSWQRHDSIAAGDEFARLRSEVAALANRYVWIEESLVENSTEVRRVQGRLCEAQAEVTTLKDRQEQMERQIGDSAKLFLVNIQNGLFLLTRGELSSDVTAAAGGSGAHVIRLARVAAKVVAQRSGVTTMTAVDAGAHLGLVSVPLARIFHRVLSFEPNDFNYRILQANILLNHVGASMHVHQHRLFSHAGELSPASPGRLEIPLHHDYPSNLEPPTLVNEGASTGLDTTRLYSLDSLGLTDLAFMKLDVRDADSEVIGGAMETMDRCRPWLVFERERHLSRASTVTFNQINDKLTELGYVVRVLRSENDDQTDYVAVPFAESTRLDRFLDNTRASLSSRRKD